MSDILTRGEVEAAVARIARDASANDERTLLASHEALRASRDALAALVREAAGLLDRIGSTLAERDGVCPLCNTDHCGAQGCEWERWTRKYARLLAAVGDGGAATNKENP